MKIKIIVIGKKGLLGSNLNLYLKKNNFILNLDYKNFLKKKINFINKFDYVINCTSNREYIKNKYLKKNDFDLSIANKIKDIDIQMIMLIGLGRAPSTTSSHIIFVRLAFSLSANNVFRWNKSNKKATKRTRLDSTT